MSCLGHENVSLTASMNLIEEFRESINESHLLFSGLCFTCGCYGINQEPLQVGRDIGLLCHIVISVAIIKVHNYLCTGNIAFQHLVKLIVCLFCITQIIDTQISEWHPVACACCAKVTHANGQSTVFYLCSTEVLVTACIESIRAALEGGRNITYQFLTIHIGVIITEQAVFLIFRIGLSYNIFAGGHNIVAGIVQINLTGI